MTIVSQILYLNKQSIFDILRKAYFTTLDNELQLHFKKKSNETKHILLKPNYVGLRICKKKKLCLKRVTNAFYIRKIVADETATAYRYQANNFQ